MPARRSVRAFALALLGPTAAFAGGVQTLEPVNVRGGATQLVGTADSPSEGTVTRQQIETRPLLRPAEVLETVPGLIATQHSGDGKANQYFLRGFNLDHGTDFATSVLGVPINLPTHAHGQGYTDLNFLIPELVDTLKYRKGPYSVLQGDFATAGAASIEYVRAIDPFAELGLGENGYRRALAAATARLGDTRLLVAAETAHSDGPWDVPEAFRKNNAVVRWSQGTLADGFDVSLLAYDARWTATDQVAQRAIDSGLIGRFGSLDPTSGGSTRRIALSSQWAARTEDGATSANAYFVDYRLALFSNFTYLLSDPVNGDQFEQEDRRRVFGAGAQHTRFGTLFGAATEWTFGGLLRQDRIDPVALYLTRARVPLATVRQDVVTQRSAAVFIENGTQWTDWFRTVLGARTDTMDVRVDSDTPANSGSRSATLTAPKAALVFGPFARTELFVNYGHGFHSNDARGAVISVNPDPRDAGFGQAQDRVPLLVRARGAEVGLRTALVPGLQTSLALWRLDLGSELVFSGDAGNTEPSRPSRRQGIELANFWSPRAGWLVDADLAWSRARFTDDDPAGPFVPDAIVTTLSVGVTYDERGPWFGGARLRYFGPRALIEDNSVRSQASTLVNLLVGRRQGPVELRFEVLNVLDARANDIEYFYTSRLEGEAADGAADRHVHPTEPRTFRVALRWRF